MPASAFYEWQKTDGGKTRLPWAVARADGEPLALAGLWEGWRGPGGEVVRSFVIITTPATGQLRFLHDRMPAIIEPADWAAWLGEVDGEPWVLLKPSERELCIRRVSPAINDVRNDGEAFYAAEEPSRQAASCP